MELIDTHTHLYLEEFDPDRDRVIDAALEKGVSCFYLPNIDVTSLPALYRLCESRPDHCFPMMGLHPCSVKPDYKSTLSRIESELGKGDFHAVGEIGIDLYWDKTTRKEQEDAFNVQLDWACELGLPVAIHSRDATEEILGILEARDRNPGGIFHCFTGTGEQAQKAIGLGFLLGIGGVLTFKNSGLAEVVSKLPLEKLVLETDAPYLAPAPFRGKRNEPSYLSLVAEKLSGVKDISLQETARATTANARALFQRN